MAHSLQFLRAAQGLQGTAANEARGRKLHAAGEVLPDADRKQVQRQKGAVHRLMDIQD